jgi:hypothetical protein
VSRKISKLPHKTPTAACFLLLADQPMKAGNPVSTNKLRHDVKDIALIRISPESQPLLVRHTHGAERGRERPTNKTCFALCRQE